jgi:hypothetical protein
MCGAGLTWAGAGASPKRSICALWGGAAFFGAGWMSPAENMSTVDVSPRAFAFMASRPKRAAKSANR